MSGTSDIFKYLFLKIFALTNGIILKNEEQIIVRLLLFKTIILFLNK